MGVPDYPIPVFNKSMNIITIIILQQDESAKWQERVLVRGHRPPIWVEEENRFPANPYLKTLDEYLGIIT